MHSSAENGRPTPETVRVYPVAWDTRDIDGVATVLAFGKTDAGESACVRIRMPVFFYVKNTARGPGALRLRLAEYVTDLGCDEAFTRVVDRKDIFGYSPEPAAGGFVQLGFASFKAASIARAHFRQRKVQVYEAGVDGVMRLCHVRGVTPSEWFDVRNAVPGGSKRISRCDVELVVDFRGVSRAGDQPQPRIVVASWDIECMSSRGGFPNADNEGDCIIQIATAFSTGLKTVVGLGPIDPVEGVDVIAVDTEAELLEAWFDLLRRESVDVLIGYNVWQFDWKYVQGRLGVLTDDAGEPLVDVSVLGRCGAGGDLRESKLSSAAYGQNTFTYLATPGVLQLDLLQYVRREYRLDSYSLKNVAKAFLADEKIDLPAAKIFELFETGRGDARAEIARYAVRDTELPLQLLDKLNVWNTLTQMAAATCVPVEYLLTRGQQIKVYSVLLRTARELGYVVPDNSGVGTTEKYEGAVVLEANPGAYFDVVSALDFASLYPSIIRAHNMCYSTLIRGHRPPPGVETYAVETSFGRVEFASGAPKGVVPTLLENLARFRRDAKKRMADAKAAGDAWAVGLYNGQQLAYKIVMNSVYGFLGATKGIFPCVPIAAAVTTTGRQMLGTVQDLVRELVPGTRVVYGDTDSVMCIFAAPDDRRHDLEYHARVAADVAANVTAKFPRPIELEFEKMYYPYLLFSKKRYCGAMYTTPERMDKIDTKGIQMVRRGTIEIVREMCVDVLNKIMIDKSADAALAAAQIHVRDFMTGTVDPRKLVMSKALRGGYKNAEQPHVAVATKLFRRRGVPVPLGERVQYVFVKDPEAPVGLQSQRAEDPDFAREQGLPLDLLYYLDHQVVPSVAGLLDIVVPNAEAAILNHPETREVLASLRQTHADEVRVYKRRAKNRANRQAEITTFFSFK